MTERVHIPALVTGGSTIHRPPRLPLQRGVWRARPGGLCAGGGFGAAADGIAELLGLPQGESLAGPEPAQGWKEGTRRLWEALVATVPEQAVLEAWGAEVPSSQALHYENVRAGAAAVAGVKGAYQNFLKSMPPYPAGEGKKGSGGGGAPAYRGRGVVITGGVVKY